MDGSAAIEANRQALKRIVAMLVDMAGLAEPAPDGIKLAEFPDSPLTASLRSAPLPLKGGPRRTLPRLLWRAILRLLRPAESAARRRIIATARGLVVPPPTPRPPKPQTMEPLLRRLGIAVMMPPGGLSAVAQRAKADGGGARRIPTFPLFDPPRQLGPHTRHVPAHAAPRICVPGLTEPARLPPRPTPEDLVSAAHLTRRLAALGKALDDLAGQARRFARLRAAREAQLARTIFPIRRTRPPGGRLFRHDPNAAHPPRIREIDEILAHAHALALHALEKPDTS